jgi:hypothetical protein
VNKKEGSFARRLNCMYRKNYQFFMITYFRSNKYYWRVVYLSMEKLCFVLLIVFAFARDYPLYTQCDPKWASEKLGTSTKTICQYGQIVASLSMGLSGIGKNFDPSTLNTWLKNNKGYVNTSVVVWNALNPLGITF